MKFHPLFVRATLCAALFPGAALGADDLITLSESGIEITVRETSADGLLGLEVLLRAPDAAVRQVFDVNRPPRIVIDLDKHRFAKARSIEITNNRILRKLRTGIHPDRARVVLDLSGERIPEYSWLQKGDVVRLELTAPVVSGSLAPAKKSVALEVAPAAEVSAADMAPAALVPQPPRSDPRPAAPEPTISAEALQGPGGLPMAQAMNIPPARIGIAEAPAGRAAEAQQLRDIQFSFQEPNRQPVVKFLLTQNSKFTLVKHSPRVYELTLPDCAIGGEHLTLPQFPPQEFEGLSVIMSKSKGRDAVISIGVDKDVRVAAVAQGAEILLKTGPKRAPAR
jgi:hypothetical protein